MKKYTINMLLLLATVGFVSCKKYLDAKPDKKIVIATTLQDAQALLDNYMQFNNYYPSAGNQSDDNFYLDEVRFNMLDVTSRNQYRWAQNIVSDFDWNSMYSVVLNATVALETVNKITPNASNLLQWQHTRGAAIFHRAFALYHVAQYYAGIYDPATAAQLPGIPLRPVTDAAVPSTRGILQECWQQIAAEFTEAASLLPATVSIPSRPTKAAAFAALARAYLYMGNYSGAATAADSSLQYSSALIDFNTVDTLANASFTRFNAEVIFPCTVTNSMLFDVSFYTIDSSLYASYDANDLRRAVYFTANGNAGFGFKGSYDGDIYNGPFCGIATDEVMLIKAECLARGGHVNEAMEALNSLLVTRWRAGSFVPFTAASTQEAVAVVLRERRKELILRGTRWFDMRRLSNDAANSVEAVRNINGEYISLLPGSNRYTFLLPQKVIDLTGMVQNNR